MPRYFVDTFNSLDVIDEEGQDYADLDALRQEIRRALGAMMSEESNGRATAQLRADARDETGKRILTATLLMVIEDK